MFMTRITDRADWFPLWLEDKQSVLDTMIGSPAERSRKGREILSG